MGSDMIAAVMAGLLILGAGAVPASARMSHGGMGMAGGGCPMPGGSMRGGAGAHHMMDQTPPAGGQRQ